MKRIISILCLGFIGSLYSMSDTANEMLLRGARDGDIKVVEEALALAKKSIGRFDINTRDAKDNTALLFAVANDNEEIVKLLLENQANPSLSNYLGMTPLMWAVSNPNFNITKLLLNNGANPNLRTNGGETPVMRAAARNYKGIVELLLDNGANPNIINNKGDTALMNLLRNLEYGFRMAKRRAEGEEGERVPQENDFIGPYLDVLNILLRVTNLNLRYGGNTILEMADQSGLLRIVDLIRQELQRRELELRIRRLVETEVADLLLPELVGIVSGYLYPQ